MGMNPTDCPVCLGPCRGHTEGTVRAFGHAMVKASGHATVEASGQARVWAFGHATVRAFGHAMVKASGQATVGASGYATVEAYDQATVGASGYATVVAYDQATVEASGYATVVAFGHATVRASGQATVRAKSPYVVIRMEDHLSVAGIGGIQVGRESLSGLGWCQGCGLATVGGHVQMAKATRPDGSTQSGMTYPVGATVVASDWDALYEGECGKGLHFSPTPRQAALFNDEYTRFVLCEVAIADIAPLPAYAQYPDKIRARACRVLYEVDIDGNKKDSFP